MPAGLPLYDVTPLWRAAFWTGFLAWFGMELWISARDRLRRVKGAQADRGSIWLVAALLYAGVIAAFNAVFQAPALAIAGPATAVVALGVALIWLGIGLRTWAVVTLGRFFRTRVVVQDDHQLIRAGPYRVLRNPSYAGTLITLAGLGVALGNWLSLAAVIGLPLIGYLVRIHVEDAALRARFGGAYEAYHHRTWALVPFLW